MRNINKLPKLRTFNCVICGKEFKRHIAPSEIKLGRGKVCSSDCKRKHLSIIRRKGKYIKCAYCGKEIWTSPSERIKKKGCSECFQKRTNGNALSIDGYRVYSRIKVHRTLMEKHIKRKLLPSEIVHHINGDKLDNRIENLKIVSRAEHNKLHFSIDDGLTNWKRWRLRHPEEVLNVKKKKVEKM